MTTAVQEKLLSPLTLGALELRHRLVMAPLTRLRADEDGVPTDLQVEHYAQRASLGMIITEGTWPVREGRTWVGQPGIETQAHIDGWRKVTDAVHEAGGTIVLQIMHGGRISHPLLSGTGRVVAPSAIAAPGEIRTPEGKAEHPVPHALENQEIPGIVEAFVQGAQHARAAGFDGVQIHGANGYLLHQFTSPTSNQREDDYGGSPQNRARLSVEVTRAVAEAIGADRTSIRLSPQHDIQGALETDDADALTTYTALAEGLAPLGLAFVDVLSADRAGALVQTLRRVAGAPLVGNSGFGVVTTREEALRLAAEGTVDAVAVGRAAIANPDLFRRWEEDLGENETRPESFYVGGARGYTDYPAWQG
ncbi:alkene reductase [Nesterenkonia sp. PF2B19]|uniref:alkene reductase n=1 Tax=Nesterenkonia sp. PF2B19 TaxID=1881858 RepID=UPI0008721354|nr:alkene reductase [Nesterenkonia sp. PF2B19]OSM43568.1 alkene reductase [Nesterenkonia sp. PF2B19]